MNIPTNLPSLMRGAIEACADVHVETLPHRVTLTIHWRDGEPSTHTWGKQLQSWHLTGGNATLTDTRGRIRKETQS